MFGIDQTVPVVLNWKLARAGQRIERLLFCRHAGKV